MSPIFFQSVLGMGTQHFQQIKNNICLILHFSCTELWRSKNIVQSKSANHQFKKQKGNFYPARHMIKQKTQTFSYKKGFLGVPRFNIISFRTRVNLVPLGGINETNLCKLNSVKSDSFACLSAIKKKPAKFINRLF